MITKANDTVLDLADPPRVSQVDMFDGTTTTTATNLAQIQANPTRLPNYQTLENLLQIFVPAGTIVPWAGATAPSGWLLCDGQPYSPVTYPQLSANLAATFGNFTPDLRGRTVAGVDNMGGVSANVVTSPFADTFGGLLGFEEITLSDAEMPSHDHNANVSNTLSVNSTGSGHTHTGGTTDFAGNHNHSNGAQYNGSAEGGGGDCEMCPSNTGFAGNHQHTFTVGAGGSSHTHGLSGSIGVTLDTEGADQPHDNIQPTMFLNYIIKAH